MTGDRKSTVTMAATVIGAVGSWVGSFGLFGPFVADAARYAAPVVTFALGIVFGWLFRDRVIVPERDTPHNKLCKKLLADLDALPHGERHAHVVKLAEHDRIEGRHDTVNAVESLAEQGCIRNVEVRWHLDGEAGIYALDDISTTGKRYVND